MAAAVAQMQGAMAVRTISEKLGLSKRKEPPKDALSVPQQNLLRTARVLWVIAYSILWVGLVPRGWQRSSYSGTRTINGQTYHTTYLGSYGLWDVAFQLTSEVATIPYAIWGSAQRDKVPLTLVQLTQAFMLFASVSGAVIFLAHFRAFCAKDPEVQKRYDLLATWFSLPLFLFTASATITWKCIPGWAFAVFCTTEGCVHEADPTAAVSFSWVFVLISAVVSLFLTLTLWRLAMWTEESEEVEVELDAVARGAATRRPPPETPGKTIGGLKNPIEYFSVARVSDTPSGIKEKEQLPPWLQGV